MTTMQALEKMFDDMTTMLDELEEELTSEQVDELDNTLCVLLSTRKLVLEKINHLRDFGRVE